MTWDDIERRWHEIKHWFASDWTYFSDDEIDALAGDRESLIGAIRDKYDLSRESAEDETQKWLEKVRAGTTNRQRD